MRSSNASRIRAARDGSRQQMMADVSCTFYHGLLVPRTGHDRETQKSRGLGTAVTRPGGGRDVPRPSPWARTLIWLHRVTARVARQLPHAFPAVRLDLRTHLHQKTRRAAPSPTQTFPWVAILAFWSGLCSSEPFLRRLFSSYRRWPARSSVMRVGHHHRLYYKYYVSAYGVEFSTVWAPMMCGFSSSWVCVLRKKERKKERKNPLTRCRVSREHHWPLWDVTALLCVLNIPIAPAQVGGPFAGRIGLNKWRRTYMFMEG